MRLTSEQVAGLAEMASDGDDLIVNGPFNHVQLDSLDVVKYVVAHRVGEPERVRIFESGQEDRVVV